jgi:putative glutamine amidotransferase
MKRSPLIGVTTSITFTPKAKNPERAFVNSSYLLAVQQAGGVPVPLPPQLDDHALEELASRLDGLLLTGGGDMDPRAFGESPHPTVYDVSPARDRLEMTLVLRCMNAGKPILAICRGIQVLNVALGGTLYQDVASDPGSQIQHQQDKDGRPRDEPTHPVKIAAGSVLGRVLGVTELPVNSLHHQAVKAPGEHLVAVAHSPDQIIEGIELEGPDPARFVLGVQWHPEELVSHDSSARNLFSALVNTSRK